METVTLRIPSEKVIKMIGHRGLGELQTSREVQITSDTKIVIKDYKFYLEMAVLGPKARTRRFGY